MTKLHNSITINRPIDEVFAYVTDVRNYVKWQEEVTASEFISSGSLGVGSTFKFSADFLGRKLETGGEVTAYDPPHLFSWKSTSGPIPIQGTTTFRSVEGGTLVEDEAELEPGGFFKLAGPLLTKQMNNTMARDSQKLKEILEN